MVEGPTTTPTRKRGGAALLLLLLFVVCSVALALPLEGASAQALRQHQGGEQQTEAQGKRRMVLDQGEWRSSRELRGVGFFLVKKTTRGGTLFSGRFIIGGKETDHVALQTSPTSLRRPQPSVSPIADFPPLGFDSRHRV